MQLTFRDSNQWRFDTLAIFYDSFNATVRQPTSLSNLEKFNYLRCYLESDALEAIAGFSLTNDSYKEALELLKNSYGNTQQIISAHMNTLVKLKPSSFHFTQVLSMAHHLRLCTQICVISDAIICQQPGYFMAYKSSIVTIGLGDLRAPCKEYQRGITQRAQNIYTNLY